MVFNMRDTCIADLVGIHQGDVININDVYLVFTSSSQKKIIDLFTKDGGIVNAQNQDLVVDNMSLKRLDYDIFKNLQNKKFKATLKTVADFSDKLYPVEFTLGNFDLSCEKSKVFIDGDKVIIRNVEMVIFPFGDYSYKM